MTLSRGTEMCRTDYPETASGVIGVVRLSCEMDCALNTKQELCIVCAAFGIT